MLDAQEMNPNINNNLNDRKNFGGNMDRNFGGNNQVSALLLQYLSVFFFLKQQLNINFVQYKTMIFCKSNKKNKTIFSIYEKQKRKKIKNYFSQNFISKQKSER